MEQNRFKPGEEVCYFQSYRSNERSRIFIVVSYEEATKMANARPKPDPDYIKTIIKYSKQSYKCLPVAMIGKDEKDLTWMPENQMYSVKVLEVLYGSEEARKLFR